MGDTPKRTRMSLREIDRLLTDSPMPTSHRVGGVAGATPRPLPAVTITDEDLALLDETEMEEQPSSSPAVLRTTAKDETTKRTTPITTSRIAEVFSAEQAVTAPSNPMVAGTSDKQTERTPSTNADRMSISGSNYSPPLCSPNKSTEQQSNNRRSSLSQLAYGWSTMMGHPIAGSVAEELAAQQHPAPVFSPLLAQSSKLVTDMVSSLLSPWSTASRRLKEQAGFDSSCFAEETSSVMGNDDGEEPVLGDRSCEESLINAFGKIVVADGYSSEREEVFFSPTRERQSTDSKRESFIRRSVNVTLKSSLMEDTCCDATFMSETSHYSDATSALPSPLQIFKPSDQQQVSYSSLDKPVQKGDACLSLEEFKGEYIEVPATDIDLTPIGGVSRRTLLKEKENEGTSLDYQQYRAFLASPLTPAEPIEEYEKVLCHAKEMNVSNVQKNLVEEMSFVSPRRAVKSETSRHFYSSISGQQPQVILMDLDKEPDHPGVSITGETMTKDEILGVSKLELIIPEFQLVDTTGYASLHMPGTEFPCTHAANEEQIVCEEPDKYFQKESPGNVSKDVRKNFVEQPEGDNIRASEDLELIFPEDGEFLEDIQKNSVEQSEPCLLAEEEVIKHNLFSPPLSAVRVSPLPAAVISEQPEQSSRNELLESVVPDVPEYIPVKVPDHHEPYFVEGLSETDIPSIHDVILCDQQKDHELSLPISAQPKETAYIQQHEPRLEPSERPEFCVSQTSPEAKILPIPDVVSGEIQLEVFERSEVPKFPVSAVSADLQVVSELQQSCIFRDSSKIGGSQISVELQGDICLSQKLPEDEVPSFSAITFGPIHTEASEQLKSTNTLISTVPEDSQIPSELQEHSVSNDISGVGFSKVDVQTEVSYQTHDLLKSRFSTVPAELSEHVCNVSMVGGSTHPSIVGEYIQMKTSEHSQNLSEPRVSIVPRSIAEDIPRASHDLPKANILVDAVITDEPLTVVYEQPKWGSLNETVSVVLSLPEDVPMEVKLAEETIAQNNSAMEFDQEASEHSIVIEDSDSAPVSERTQVTESQNSSLCSPEKQIDNMADVTTTSVSKTPKSIAEPVRIPTSLHPSMMSMIEDDSNRSRCSLKRTPSQCSSFRRDSTDNSTSIRKSLSLEEEADCRSIGASLNRTTGRRRTITLEKPSPHLQASLSRSGQIEATPPIIRRSGVPGIKCSSKIASDDLTDPDDKKRRSSPTQKCLLIHEGDVNQVSSAVGSIELGQEDKENIAPEGQNIVTNHRTTQHLLMPSATAEARRTPSKVAIASQQQQSEIEGPVEEEKARLHEQVQALREKRDVLRLILAKYQSTFEETLDNQSRIHFATSSAGAQADQEAHDARRQAATLHNAVLESQRRQERMREEIERRRINQDKIIKRTESLKEKYLRLLEKGQTYQKYCLNKIQKAVEHLEMTKTELDKELSRLRVQFKQLELKLRSLEANLEQKGKENEELTKICDNLLKGVL
ncbi:unnamed protein product [Hymenolepis diminuta]|uniref:Transforming acidic coiled-coil-containing protein C-terminal domain-containing protein n=1 Tax=Hymenolepis diminuta TaxID=6216 RepID=A0A564Z2L9_HYMDI|nr:unnamed protein product [Hymenolepis diminuta]